MLAEVSQIGNVEVETSEYFSHCLNINGKTNKAEEAAYFWYFLIWAHL